MKAALPANCCVPVQVVYRNNLDCRERTQQFSLKLPRSWCGKHAFYGTGNSRQGQLVQQWHLEDGSKQAAGPALLQGQGSRMAATLWRCHLWSLTASSPAEGKECVSAN